MGDDVKAIKDWAGIFKNPKLLAHLATKHAILNHTALMKDVTAEKADWISKNYFHAGVDAADMMTILVGPIKKAYLEAKYKGVTFNPLSVPEYVAGLMYGLTGENHLDELTKCLNVGDDLIKQAQTVA